MEKNRNLIFGLSRIAIISFIAALFICTFMISAIVITREQNQALQTEQFLMEKGLRIVDTLSTLFFKTEVLTALVQYGEGDIVGFDGIAPLIVDNPVITKLLIAPDGVVSKVYSSYEDLSEMVGHDYFRPSVYGNIEAVKAVEMGELVIAGPFTSRYGRTILAGRAPVYLDREQTEFWGLVSVAVRFPEALDNAELGRLRAQGYEYELWRINPDTSERQVLSTNVQYANLNARFVDSSVQFMNANWYLRLKSTRVWYTDVEVISLIILGFFICLLVMFVGQNYSRLRQAKTALDVLAKTDPLTGINNRRNFIDLVESDSTRTRTAKNPSYITLVDADFFKKVNDTYGHLAGDKVLVEIAKRLKEATRASDIVARYGGEEFILYLPNMTKNTAQSVTERIRLAICERPFEVAENTFQITVSLGAATIETSLEKAIKNADDALYEAKQSGRNRVVFHGS
ncbi:MAG: sensor domain-containing diguanylate cyclase [Defluviitaleaceae bacterium]|nr:sensor domain-containing diguanylate cyclase [Defluviitaleaceae bacterium]MCL2274510.1 sensor domain-containing diguanylate cyclase [Defluviitaleaceae bacterium]